MLGGERIADHVADIVGDEIGLFDLERVQHPGDIARLGFLVVSARRTRREADAAQVRDDDDVPGCQFGRERRPHVAGLAIAVEQQDGRPLAPDAHMKGRAVGRDLLRAEAGRERRHLRSGGERKQDCAECGDDCRSKHVLPQMSARGIS